MDIKCIWLKTESDCSMSHIVINRGYLRFNGLRPPYFSEMSDKNEIQKLKKMLKEKDKLIVKLEAEGILY